MKCLFSHLNLEYLLGHDIILFLCRRHKIQSTKILLIHSKCEIIFEVIFITFYYQYNFNSSNFAITIVVTLFIAYFLVIALLSFTKAIVIGERAITKEKSVNKKSAKD